MKTIRMPKALLDRWLVALRGGEYRQGRQYLSRDGAYCCLGVLQVLADGEVERDQNGPSLDNLPSHEWLQANGIKFYDSEHQGVCCRNPYLPKFNCSAVDANDGEDSGRINRRTFVEIAEAIEATAEGY